MSQHVHEFTKDTKKQNEGTSHIIRELVNSVFNFGLKMHQNGQIEDALAAYGEVLNMDPKHVDALQLIGVIFVQFKQPKKAIPYFNRSIEICPKNHIAMSNRGRAHEDLGDYFLAKCDYQNAIKLDKNNLAYYHNLINVCRLYNDNEYALKILNQLISKNKLDYKLLNNKGVVLFELGRHNEAIEVYEYILKNEVLPDYLNNYGNALLALKKYDQAIDKYNRAIELDPNHHRSYINRGHAFKALLCLPRALVDYQKAVSINPSDNLAIWNEALGHLTLKRYEIGFSKYESRLHTPELKNLIFNSFIPTSIEISHHISKESYSNRHVFVASEQGIGDEIMFLSILPDLLRDARQVTVQCDGRLLELFQRSFPTVRFIDKNDDKSLDPKTIDIALRAGSLGYSYRRDISLASGEAFLKTDQEKVNFWRNRLPADKINVGISWQGGTDRTNREGRTVDLEQLRPLIEDTRINFISIQHGDVLEELEQFNKTISNKISILPQDELRNIDDLATLINATDAIVSVQNTNVHLSGALGKTCYAMMPKVPEWRYGIDGNTMPWYSSVELFRPKDYGNWGGMAKAIRVKLHRNFGR